MRLRIRARGGLLSMRDEDALAGSAGAAPNQTITVLSLIKARPNGWRAVASSRVVDRPGLLMGVA
jgi:hypothetical protein